MKLLFATALLAIAGCNNADQTGNAKMPGVYKMLSQSVKSAKTDTTYSSLQQLKMFTADYMMYANFSPSDSVSSFGIGSYSVNKDTVTENVLYNASDTTKSDMANSFKLVIEKTSRGYRQVIPDITTQSGDHIKLTEEYETAGTAVTSPLDGAWKQIKRYSIKGADTTSDKTVQYKMYGGGHFIFGNTWSDSTNKNHTGMGYGTFVMNGNNKSKETVMVSTYSTISGQSFDLEIEMIGTDEYKQTITDKDGTKGVEVYQRMKK